MNRLTRIKTSGAAELIMPVSAGKNPVTRSAYRQIGIDKLADYEEAEESGLLVRLPCRVGDTVYLVAGTEIYDMTVTMYETREEESTVYLSDGYYDGDDGDEYDIDCFGKTVFLTREEAEAALKGVDGE